MGREFTAHRRANATAALAAALWLAVAPGAGATDIAAGEGPAPFRVGATAIVRNAAIEAMYDGMVDRLRALGYRPGENVRVRFEDARADTARAADIVRAFVSERTDVIVAFTLPSVRAALNAGGRTPVVVAGVDAEAVAKLNRFRRARPLTGITRGATDEEQFAMIRTMMPGVRTVAIAVDPELDGMHARLRELMAIGRIAGLAVARLPVSLTRGAVGGTIRELPAGEAAILIDATTLPDAPVEALVAAGNEHGLPVFATDEAAVVRGAIAAMVVDPYGIGEQTGELVAQILSQPAAARQPFARARATRMVVNREAASLASLAAPEPGDDPHRFQVLEWSDDAAPRPRLKPHPPDEPPPLAVAEDGEASPVPRPDAPDARDAPDE